MNKNFTLQKKMKGVSTLLGRGLLLALLLACSCLASAQTPRVRDEGTHWTPTYGYNGWCTITAQVSIDGVAQTSEDLEVGAFIDNECRASWKLEEYDTDVYVVYLSVNGQYPDDNGKTIAFQLFDHAQNMVLPLTCTSTYQWADNASWGDMEPVAIEFSNNGGNILFADDNVKSLCVANWDTDGDGELSYAEAAAVTSLGGVFEYNDQITSFNELQYFSGLSAIEGNAFISSGITSVVIPNSVTSIGGWAFHGCNGLISIEIPNSVIFINDCAFEVCTGLTLIAIPHSVTSIGNYAFSYCDGLTSMTVHAEIPPTLGGDVFEYVNTDIPVYVPCGSIEAYQNAEGWSAFTNYQCLENNHEYVDLGLPSGLLWATCNIGADSPEDYGDYFAWGETQPKDYYDWSTYQYCMGSENTLTKYCNNPDFGYNGYTDDLTTLLPEDDAATANWGSDWRMPTKEELEELYNNTTHTWTTQNGVSGRLFTAANGASLFLPAAGNRWDGELVSAGSGGRYWSRSLYTDYPSYAWNLRFYSDDCYMDYDYRLYGFSVRPVRAASQYMSSLSDDFDDGIINPDYWTATGTHVLEEDGLMKVQQNVTDNYTALESVPMSVPSNNKIVIDRSFLLHEELYWWNAGDRYFLGNTWIKFDGSEDNYIGIIYYDYDWDDYGATVNRYGTYIRTQINGVASGEIRICDAVFDTWMNEVIVVDFTENTVSYYRDNAFIATIDIPAFQPSFYTVRFKPDGWWTGHYHNMDYININTGLDGTFSVTATANPAEGGTVSGGGTYECLTTCTLTATANEGYFFSSWTENGNIVSTDAEYSFTVLGDRDLVANFTEVIVFEDLIAYYPFDGDPNDYSGNEYHATPYNSFYYETGITGASIAVQGSGYTGSNGGHVLLPELDFGEATGFTLTLWVKALGLTHNDGEAYINFGSDNESDRLYIMHHPDQIRFTYHEAEITMPLESNYIGNWMMYTLTCDEEGTLKAYANGNLVGEQSVTFNGINTSLAALGRHWWSGTTYTRLNASLDEVRIYSRALTEEEIQTLHGDMQFEVTATATEGGTVTGGGTYSHGATCTLTATANEDYVFLYWTVDGNIVSYEAEYSFPVLASRTYMAHFSMPTFVSNPCPIDLGFRPNNAWMRPFTATVTNTGGVAEITGIEASTDYFQLDLGNLSLPFTMNQGDSFGLTLGWGTGEGIITGDLLVGYGDGETASLPMQATAYTPGCPDVWEMALNVNMFPFVHTPATMTTLYNNYTLPYPEIPDGNDAVYRLFFEEDTYLNASVVEGENGKVALYREGFEGLGGPDEENYYRGSGMAAEPFEAQIGEGTTTLGYFPFYTLYNYSISENLFLASELVEAGVTSCPMTSLSWYATNETGYYQQGISIWMANVSDTELTGTSHLATGMTLVYTGAMTPQVGWNEFVFNEGTFAWDGASNILILCQRNNGSWNSTVNWQTHNPGFTAYNEAHTDNYSYDVMNNTYGMNIRSGHRANIIMKAGQTRAQIGGRDIGVITDMTVPAGSYYLVASSTSDEWTVLIDAGEVPCPDAAYNPVPANGAVEVEPNQVTLVWTLGERTTAWRFVFSATSDFDPNNEATIIYPTPHDYGAFQGSDGYYYTTQLAQTYTVFSLNNNTVYYWQVCERNDGCPEGVASEVWSFTTHLNVPLNAWADGNQMFVGDDNILHWDTPNLRGLTGYNIYENNVWIGSTTENSYYIGQLPYNMNPGYRYNVTAVYDEGESAYSNDVWVYVSGFGSVEGYVVEQDSITPIANATVIFNGTNEFGWETTYELGTDENGYYSGTLQVGNYNAQATCTGYQPKNYGPTVQVGYEQALSGIDFIMDEVFTPVGGEVVAEYYPDADDPNSPYVKVYWSIAPETNRGFMHHRVYRTDEYNDGPFTEDNTEVIAEATLDTLLIDSSWADIEMGGYKYGVSSVYAGNHIRGGNRDVLFSDDFENGMGNWTSIDADGDGYNWVLGSNIGGVYLNDGSSFAGSGHFGSYDMACSGSWTNVSNTVLYPDNYLVSPQVTLGGTFSFWACTQDTNYPSEHFGVAVSTGSNTNPNDFAIVQEWTMTAKGSRDDGPRGSRAQGNWYQYSVDLSEYSGQTGYIAIRHFNCSDMFVLNIDDVELTAPGVQGPRESEIVWSNPIAKDMLVSGVSLTVTLNSGDSPEGTLVQFVNQNVNEQTHHPVADVVLDDSGYYAWDVFRKGDYVLTLSKEGYETLTDTVSITEATSLQYELTEIIVPTANAYVSRTGWASWTANRHFNAYELTLTDLNGNILYSGETLENALQLPVENLTDGETYHLAVRSAYSSGNSEWAETDWVYESCDHFAGATDLYGQTVDEGVMLSWTYPEIEEKGERLGEWHYYDNGEFATSIGTGGGQFWWGVMFPAGSYSANSITKVSAYDPIAMNGTVTIYNNNDDNMPSNEVGSMDISFTGSSDFVEFTFNNPVSIDVTKNVWVVFYNSSGATYPAAASGNTGDLNGRWVSIDGSSWEDMANYGLDYIFMVRAYFENIFGLSTMVFRDGEYLGITTDDTFFDEGGSEAHEYTIRVVYGGEATCPDNNFHYAMSCPQAFFTTQTTQFVEGWTWWNSYIELDNIDGLGLVEEGLGDNGLIIKSHHNGFVSQYNGLWVGSLKRLDNESTYLIQTSAPCELQLTGQPVVAAQHPIELPTGWTWLGYPVNEAMSVDDAFAGMELATDNIVKSQNAFATYNGTQWVGSLKTLTPGAGYMFKSNNASTVTLVYPNGAAKGGLEANITAESNHWRPNLNAYPTNMTMMAVVELDGVELAPELVEGPAQYELAAFANGECRGSARLMEVDGRGIAFLTVAGNEAAELHFSLFNTLTGESYHNAAESLVYAPDAVFGAIDEPFVVHFSSITGLDEALSAWQVYPNPVNCGETFRIGHNDDGSIALVEIVNALGVVVESVKAPAQSVVKAPKVAGVYTLRITVEGKGVQCKKLIVR